MQLRALEAAARGEIGAVVVVGDEVVGRGRNRMLEKGDPRAHAEMEAIDAARAGCANGRLDGGTLVVTLDNAVNPLVALRNAIPPRLLRRAGLVHYPLGVTCGPRRFEALVRAAGFAVPVIASGKLTNL